MAEATHCVVAVNVGGRIDVYSHDQYSNAKDFYESKGPKYAKCIVNTLTGEVIVEYGDRPHVAKAVKGAQAKAASNAVIINKELAEAAAAQAEREKGVTHCVVGVAVGNRVDVYSRSPYSTAKIFYDGRGLRHAKCIVNTLTGEVIVEYGEPDHVARAVEGAKAKAASNAVPINKELAKAAAAQAEADAAAAALAEREKGVTHCVVGVKVGKRVDVYSHGQYSTAKKFYDGKGLRYAKCIVNTLTGEVIVEYGNPGHVARAVEVAKAKAASNAAIIALQAEEAAVAMRAAASAAAEAVKKVRQVEQAKKVASKAAAAKEKSEAVVAAKLKAADAAKAAAEHAAAQAQAEQDAAKAQAAQEKAARAAEEVRKAVEEEIAARKKLEEDLAHQEAADAEVKQQALGAAEAEEAASASKAASAAAQAKIVAAGEAGANRALATMKSVRLGVAMILGAVFGGWHVGIIISLVSFLFVVGFLSHMIVIAALGSGDEPFTSSGDIQGEGLALSCGVFSFCWVVMRTIV